VLTNPAIHRYYRRVILLTVIYVVLLIATIYLFLRSLPHGPIAYVAALLPAMPLSGTFLVLGRYMAEETDEYLRMLMIRQSLIATGFMLSVATAWGFLEGFGLVPHVVAYYASALWFAGLWIGWGYNILTMRRPA
jgi:hypothetical protein